MSDRIDLIITSAGLAALVDAQSGNTDAIRVVEVGLTEAIFDPAPTLNALPGEFKRIDSFAGESVAENIIHMTGVDQTTDTYDLRGIALYLEDGTLFASFGQADPIFSKVSIAQFLFAFDVRFSGVVSGDIVFGDATFLYPPASETIKGVAELATQDETDAGDDDERIVTPKKLKTVIDAVVDALQQMIATLTGRTITGSGLATGGGNLSANRQITVSAAIGAEIAAGTEAGKAVTPLAIASVPQTFGGNSSIRGLGGSILKTGTVNVGFPGGGSHTFATAFPTACDRVLLTPLGNPDGSDEADEPWWVGNMSASGFSVSTANDGVTASFAFLAIGH
ncbi:gp53-like domain-containing protein [Qipengyuania citrea]|uniref:gp53-like domain-containing protein n=1 Tax=Qipengyuania citrea TaxID=225971 RepID=UPI0020A16075|nr:hypothetical protein [Qipengyuania citrea]MCP2016839.1 hypothetical protein [Qipengyuania citrea]